MIGGASGIGIGLDFGVGKQRKQTQEKSYIDQAVLDSLVCVVSTYGKTNTDADRNILKDKTKKGNDLRLLNFGFAGNSGYGLYEANFTDWLKYTPAIVNVDSGSITIVNNTASNATLYRTVRVGEKNSDIPSFKIEVSGTNVDIVYQYINSKGTLSSLRINKIGEYIIPVSHNSLYVGDTNVWTGFSSILGCNATIEQLPDFEGWLCTDGVDDLIESVKPVSEMLEGSNEITVVSIIHQISSISDTARASTNNIRSTNDTFGARNLVELQGVGKTGIYGYTCANIKVNSPSLSIVNSILGDKNDYSCSGINFKEVDTLSIQGFINQSNGSIKEVSQIAYAGGFIANKVLTTDEINQVIAYYNLDRPGKIIKPQLYCNIKKQGITNDNHAEFNDQLIDFVGGRNIQLNNISWEKQSGIGNYPISFKDYTYIPARGTVEINRDSFVITSNTSTANLLEVNTRTKVLPAYKVKIEGTSTIKEGNLKWRINTTTAVTTYIDVFEDGIYDIPATPQTEEAAYSGWCISKYHENVNVKVTILPEEGSQYALYLDGISDFGKATGLPILKDYTVVADRKILGNNEGGTLSKSYSAGNGAFIFETRSVIYSFGTGTSGSGIQSKRMLSYLSKYIYNGNPVQAGAGIDSDSMWLGTLRDNDTRFAKLALWSLMLFPYSLSEFLLERQLKKYKVGTLYPDVVEFRPIIKSNVPYKSVRFFYQRRYGESTEMFPGEYYSFPFETAPAIYIEPYAPDEPISVTINGEEYSLYYNEDGTYSSQFSYTKSPQKIDIIIEKNTVLSNIKNSTLISNKQLIKNNK